MLGLGIWLVGLVVALDLARRALVARHDRGIALCAALVVAVEAIFTLIELLAAITNA